MDDRPSAQSFPGVHHHCQRPAFHLASPGLRPHPEPLERREGPGDDSAPPFPPSGGSPGGRRLCGGDERGFRVAGGHPADTESGLDGPFNDIWYGGGKKEVVWDQSCESAGGDCYGQANGVTHARRTLGADCGSYVQVKTENGYDGEAATSHFTRLTTSHSRRAAGDFGGGGGDFCRADSRACEGYFGRDGDYGEDQLQLGAADGPWLGGSPSDGRWRGDAGAAPAASPPQRSRTQRLDSFSEAFLSQRKRMFPATPGGDPAGQMWAFGEGRGGSPGPVQSEHGCAFDSDPYLTPCSFPSAFPSFPSPPVSSHVMSSVLSPPPTPLPPPSHSPSKLDSPGSFGAHSVCQEGGGDDSLGTLQFLTSHFQSLPSVNAPGVLWKFPPLLSYCYPQYAGDPGSNGGHLGTAHNTNDGAVPHDVAQSPEPSFLASSPHRSSLHLASPPSHPLPGPPREAAEKTAACCAAQSVKNGGGTLKLKSQRQAAPVYTGTPFPSRLHSQKRGHYTAPPLLNPGRGGPGLYSTLSSLHHPEAAFEEEEEEEEDCVVLRHVNVGPEFQAALPPCFPAGGGSAARTPGEESPGEQLLWKPREELEERDDLQSQVKPLLTLCSSSCLPGGGSNTELALHCLHLCQGNKMATLEMLLFGQPSPAGDYRYSGSDFWTDAEKIVFAATLSAYGKDFAAVQKRVTTKTVSQCIEYYYLSKKLLDKQKKRKEEEDRDRGVEQQKSVPPICQPVARRFGSAEAVPVPSLAGFFPCKLCGKMFYKIKSRNAHMKIHRQPQEDWADGRLRQQLLSQGLAASNLLPPQAPPLSFPSSGLPGTPSNTGNADNILTNSNTTGALDPRSAARYSIPASNSHIIPNMDNGDANQRQPAGVSPFHQSWASFGHGPGPAVFYCNAGGKEDVGTGKGGLKEPIMW